MCVTARLWTVVFCVAMAVTGCASPPTTTLDAARAAVESAVSSGAGQYAAESLKAAQDAQAALDAELKAQDANWFKSYDKTTELAAAAKSAGEKALADATAAKAKVEASARAAAAAEAARAKVKAEAVRVGGQVRPPVKVKDATPLYPAIARSARIAGTVTIEATIGPDGKVADARVVKSVPMLDQAALDAVEQWEYTPGTLNGKPVPVIITVNVNFRP